jgi:hypothetical protein
MEIKITKYESTPEWNSMEIKGKWNSMEISSDSDGVVEFEFSTSADTGGSVFLDQDELKQLIEFLQTKVTKD